MIELPARLLHIINDLRLGGTEHLFARHVALLDREYPSIENDVLVLEGAQDAHEEYLRLLPVTPDYLGFSGRYRNLPESLRCMAQIRSRLKRLKPDLVHSYLWNADLFTSIAKMGIDVPHVAHIVDRRGGRNQPRLSGRMKNRFTAWLHRRGTTGFAAVSEACKTHAVENFLVDPDDVVVAFNGIPVEQFERRQRDIAAGRPIVAGAISNFMEEKGHIYLIEAFRILADQQVPVTLKIAGGGRARKDFEAMVEQRGLSSQIEFVGRVPSAAEFYSEIDLFVIPSIYAEGLPTTILEAMAARLPIVATDVGGATEAVRHGQEGIIIPAKDVQALAGAIAALESDRHRMQQFGDAGHRRVRAQFTLQAMSATIVNDLYAPLIDCPDLGRRRAATQVRLAH